MLGFLKRLLRRKTEEAKPACDHDWERKNVQRQTSGYGHYDEEKGLFSVSTHLYVYSWECSKCGEFLQVSPLGGPTKLEGTKQLHVAQIVDEWEVSDNE